MLGPANPPPGLKSLNIRFAQGADAEPLASLINSAFRVEQPFIDGDRTSTAGVREYMQKGKFLLAEDSAGLAGCVYVELRGDEWLCRLALRRSSAPGYRPGPQVDGRGEKHFREAGCRAIDLRIVSARTPLPSFYRRLGYTETGTPPFPLACRPRFRATTFLCRKISLRITARLGGSSFRSLPASIYAVERLVKRPYKVSRPAGRVDFHT